MELIKMEIEDDKITSNMIAELTGKEHGHVKRDIEKILIEIRGLEEHPKVDSDISESTFLSKQNKRVKNYTLSKDGLMLIITGYSATHRMKLIKYCRELENNIALPSYQIVDPIARAEAWIKEQKIVMELEYKTKEQEMLITEYEPKVEYYDSILRSDDLLTVTQIAKDYDISGQSLNKILHEEKVQYKQSGQWLLYSQHLSKGYTKSETVEYDDGYGNIRTKLNTKWRQKGRIMIHNLLESKGVKANMDKEC